MYIHLYVYVRVRVCVCECVCVRGERGGSRGSASCSVWKDWTHVVDVLFI